MNNVIPIMIDRALQPLLRFPPLRVLHPYIEKAILIAEQRFHYIQHGFIFSFGAKELFWDKHKATHKAAGVPVESSRKTEDFLEAHGIFFVASGIAGIAAEFVPGMLMEYASQTLFTLGNIIALDYNARLFREATDPVLVKSAALGIVNNLGYIMTVATIALDGPAALALLCGLIAVTVGGIKILYDALYYHGKELPF